MTQPKLFDHHLLELRRKKATQNGMFLQELARDELLEKLKDINRTFKSVAVVSGFPAIWDGVFPNAQLIGDDETLQFADQKFDLVIHAMGLHASNDPVGQIIQCKNVLTADGVFMAVCFGGQTLTELRSAISEAEIAVTGGLSPRVSPMAEIRDLGALLQRAGLSLPVADNMVLPVAHKSLKHLANDLREMGETNIMTARTKQFSKRAMFGKTNDVLKTNYNDGQGRIVSTFELVFLSGWSPHKDQPKPLRPGSITKSLSDSLNDIKKPAAD